MNAVILSAGQGKRLMPLTADNPKCLINIQGTSLIEWQINELFKNGIEQVTVVVGYQADKVSDLLHSRYSPGRVKVLFNPTYNWADNLFSCWVARAEMHKPFILLNGDTLFEKAVLNRLLQSSAKPITVATHRKRHYDADDMKVALDGKRLVSIGKDLDADIVDAESIGMILFRLDGPARFRRAVENALLDSSACKKWYLSVINEIARTSSVWTCPINGYQWCEVDFPADLKHARRVVETCRESDWNAGLLSNRYATG